MKKIIILLLLLFAFNFVNAESEIPYVQECRPTTVEYYTGIMPFINRYLETYTTLVDIQKDVDKNSFLLYNKTFYVEVYNTGIESVAYIFLQNKCISDTGNGTISFQLLKQYNISPDDPTTIYNFYSYGTYYYYVVITPKKYLEQHYAETRAYHDFLIEYQNLIVQEAKRKAEEDPKYQQCYMELAEHTKLYQNRDKQGVYHNDVALWKVDNDLFFKLAYECRLGTEEAKEYKELSITEKKLFGEEYQNNYLYSTVLSLVLFFIIIMGKYIKINTDDNSIIETVYWILASFVIAYFLTIPPYDYSISSLKTVEIIFVTVIGLFLSTKVGVKQQK